MALANEQRKVFDLQFHTESLLDCRRSTLGIYITGRFISHGYQEMFLRKSTICE